MKIKAKMYTILGAFKKILNISDELDEDEDKDLERDIRNYTAILNSPKYADSNSNTDALEQLLNAIKIKSEEQKKSQPAATQQKIVARQPPPEPEAKDKADETKDADDQEAKPRVSSRRQEFLSNLNSHLDLLRELEDENILPAQPVFQPPKFGRDGGSKFFLKKFAVPEKVYDALGANNFAVLRLQPILAPDNYINLMQALLWMEEAHQAVEMRKYDLHAVMLAKYDQSFFQLTVPGLAEGRPSLMRGDKLILKSDKRSSHYEGYIYDVRENDILIKLHESLHSTALDGLRFDISFMTSRTGYRRCHHGVQSIWENLGFEDILFPKPRQISEFQLPFIPLKETTGDELRCFMPSLNKYQRRAVINVLNAESRPAPYIIFGPPGTGKTVTMVEAVLQVYARKRGSRILVCGNSNSCADLLAKRIKDSGVVPLNQMMRLSAFYRMEKLIPPELEDITVDMNGVSNTMYAKCRIVVSTCTHSGSLMEFSQRFDYVFIDEAGHANEPEALVSIALLKSSGCIVLAGDPNQLGPVIISPLAGQNGLQTSLLERLSRRSVYMRRVRDGKMVYDERYLTKLIISYRSDPRVMSVNNPMFYDNELQFVVKTPQFWLDLLKFKYPLVFHQVKGRDRREYLNPSWFNPNEAITCLTYVKRLYEAGLKPDQLGIITPYRRQIDKLNVLFDGCQMKRCKIATMEEFQGDEREVIIISTVRTREKNLKFDQKFSLGFLFNPKRFNVAVSRAKWLVIVVGDDQILKRDPCWVEFMEKSFHVMPRSESCPEET